MGRIVQNSIMQSLKLIYGDKCEESVILSFDFVFTQINYVIFVNNAKNEEKVTHHSALNNKNQPVSDFY